MCSPDLVQIWFAKNQFGPEMQAPPLFSERERLRAPGCSAWKRRQSKPPLSPLRGSSGAAQPADALGLGNAGRSPARSAAAQIRGTHLRRAVIAAVGQRRARVAQAVAAAGHAPEVLVGLVEALQIPRTGAAEVVRGAH